MKVLVTGADGLLGSNIVRKLLEKQYEVRVFLLKGTTSKTLDGLPIEREYGDLLDYSTVEKAIKGCEVVVHAAANTSVWPVKSDFIRSVNVDGTNNIIKAAQKVDIQRFIHVSSASSFDFGTKEKPGTERSALAGDRYGLEYISSKFDAHLAVQTAADAGKLPAIIINPTFMLGPYDAKPSAGEMILSIYHSKVPGYSSGGKNFVHVGDVATAIVNAITKGRIGECYITGNVNLTYQEFFGKISSLLDCKPPRLSMPNFLVKGFGRMGTMWSKITGNKPTLSYPMALVACDKQFFSAQKAVDELDMPQTSIDIAIKESFEWMQANGVSLQNDKN